MKPRGVQLAKELEEFNEQNTYREDYYASANSHNNNQREVQTDIKPLSFGKRSHSSIVEFRTEVKSPK
jgi:hypothetical protein